MRQRQGLKNSDARHGFCTMVKQLSWLATSLRGYVLISWPALVRMLLQVGTVCQALKAPETSWQVARAFLASSPRIRPRRHRRQAELPLTTERRRCYIEINLPAWLGGSVGDVFHCHPIKGENRGKDSLTGFEKY